LKIVVLGWYGTETIGDRAILAGLVTVMKDLEPNARFSLGSLYPFFSRRTLSEDAPLYEKLTGRRVEFELFDSKDASTLDKELMSADWVMMGGGPLMDLKELYLIEYAFKKAKLLGKKTALFGCGVGPLYVAEFQHTLLRIIRHADVRIFRDLRSKEVLEELGGKYGYYFSPQSLHVAPDPAVVCVRTFQEKCPIDSVAGGYIALNLRQYPKEYGSAQKSDRINESLKEWVRQLATMFNESIIRLVPMHYFHIGGDDRAFLNRISLELGMQNIQVQNAPLSLEETMKVYQSAHLNIGMRFHAVVLQSLLSGRNYILDYTQPGIGKISGFLHDCDSEGFYRDRYVSLQDDDGFTLDIRFDDRQFVTTKPAYLRAGDSYRKVFEQGGLE
jgi:polysaccharide pyruvyl transferase WcaK-like protein